MKIKSGHHYPTPFIFPKLYSKNNLEINATLSFDDTAKYDIGKDQTDINKLLGFGYNLHHLNSDRIGWRYVPSKDKIEFLLYSYNRKERVKKHICYVDINEEISINFSVQFKKNSRYVYSTIKTKDKTYKTKAKFHKPIMVLLYGLSLYFGGNIAAPHDINIYLKKLIKHDN